MHLTYPFALRNTFRILNILLLILICALFLIKFFHSTIFHVNNKRSFLETLYLAQLQPSIERCLAETDVRRKAVLQYNFFLENLYEGDHYCYYYHYYCYCFFKADFYITFCNYKKSINVYLEKTREKLVTNWDTKRSAKSLI